MNQTEYYYNRIIYEKDDGSFGELWLTNLSNYPRNIRFPVRIIGPETTSISGKLKVIEHRIEGEFSFNIENIPGLILVSPPPGTQLISAVNEMLLQAIKGKEIRIYLKDDTPTLYYSCRALFRTYTLNPTEGYNLYQTPNLKFRATFVYNPSGTF